MNIEQSKAVLLRTHIAAVVQGHRAAAVHVESSPGVGKSEGVKQYAFSLARTFAEPVGLVIDMIASYMSADARGFMLPVKDQQGRLVTTFSTPTWYPLENTVWVVTPDGIWHEPGAWTGELPRIGIVFFDEFSQGEDDVKKALANVVLEGRLGDRKLPPLWRVVSAGNRSSDRSGVMRELMFIVNRRCRLKVEPSLPAWLDWATGDASSHSPAAHVPQWLRQKQSTTAKLHYMTIAFAQKHPDIVFADKVPDGTDPYCTPRSLQLMDRDLAALRSDEDYSNDRLPIDAVAREVCAGWVGDGAASQFFAFLKYADLLPDIADIIKDPGSAKLSTDMGAQMVTSYFLAHHIDENTAEPILKYIDRMKSEMQILCVKTVSQQVERNKALVVSPMYNRWLIKYKDILIASHS